MKDKNLHIKTLGTCLIPNLASKLKQVLPFLGQLKVENSTALQNANYN